MVKDEALDSPLLPLFEDDVLAVDPSPAPHESEKSDADDAGDEDDEEDDLPFIKSKYFAIMTLKRPLSYDSDGEYSLPIKFEDVNEVRRRKKRRRAVHDFSDSDEESLSSALSEMEERPRLKSAESRYR